MVQECMKVLYRSLIKIYVQNIYKEELSTGRPVNICIFTHRSCTVSLSRPDTANGCHMGECAVS